MSRKPDHAFRVARGCISDVVTPQLDLAVLLLVVLMMLLTCRISSDQSLLENDPCGVN